MNINTTKTYTSTVPESKKHINTIYYPVDKDAVVIKGKDVADKQQIDNFKQQVDDFENFDPSENYTTGDIVEYNGKLYKFINDHEGEWSYDDVQQTNVFTILKDMIENQPSGGPEVIEFSKVFTWFGDKLTNKTRSEFITALGITENQLNTMLDETKQCCIKFRVGDDDTRPYEIFWANNKNVAINNYDEDPRIEPGPDVDIPIILSKKIITFGISGTNDYSKVIEDAFAEVWRSVDPEMGIMPIFSQYSVSLKLTYDVINNTYSIEMDWSY